LTSQYACSIFFQKQQRKVVVSKFIVSQAHPHQIQQKTQPFFKLVQGHQFRMHKSADAGFLVHDL